MFGKITEVFDRNFLIGYFLPVLTFMIAGLELAKHFGIWEGVLDDKILVSLVMDSIIFGMASLLLSLFMITNNITLLRLMCGYGRYNPLRIFKFIEYARCEYQNNKYHRELDIYTNTKPEKRTGEQKINLIYLGREVAESIPEEDSYLPTRLGNTVAALEYYPTKMYGIDMQPAWYRLIAVIPDNYLRELYTARSYVDFWANIWIFSIIIMLEYSFLITYTGVTDLLWIPPLCLLVSTLSMQYTRTAVLEWGNFVKSAFDLFLPNLRNLLLFDKPTSFEEEKELWKNFSMASMYNQTDKMDAIRNKYTRNT